MIKNKINQKIGDALRAHNDLLLTTLRMLSSALNYEFIAKQHVLTEEEEVAVVRREVKKRNDTIETYKKLQVHDPVHVQEKIDRESAEIKILKEYLPPEMGDDELNGLVDKAISDLGVSEMKDMGRVIGKVKEKVGVSVDGKRIADLVKSKLQ